MVQVARGLAAHLARHPLCVRTVDAQVKAMIRSINCPGGPWYCACSLSRDIGVMLTTNEHIRKLNNQYRKKDKPTDILSFPFHKITEPGRFPSVRFKDERYLGDIYISLPYVQSQCEDPDNEDVTSLKERMPVLLAHGICHLLGYDHETDEDYEHMTKAEEYILERFERFLHVNTRSNTKNV
ncbi:hypothetical protein PINS_up007220 [Pythium insidiosum]|nr:hypothetical protein PINS_up007220 [Pythium insidiosum]